MACRGACNHSLGATNVAGSREQALGYRAGWSDEPRSAAASHRAVHGRRWTWPLCDLALGVPAAEASTARRGGALAGRRWWLLSVAAALAGASAGVAGVAGN